MAFSDLLTDLGHQIRIGDKTHALAILPQLQEEYDAIVQKLEERKIVEQAKGVLMQRHNMSEQAAHKRLQRAATQRRITTLEIAKIIVESEAIGTERTPTEE